MGVNSVLANFFDIHQPQNQANRRQLGLTITVGQGENGLQPLLETRDAATLQEGLHLLWSLLSNLADIDTDCWFARPSRPPHLLRQLKKSILYDFALKLWVGVFPKYYTFVLKLPLKTIYGAVIL